jgi:hypothetical protein
VVPPDHTQARQRAKEFFAMNEILAKLAPTVASALLGPMGGIAVSAIGKILGIDAATTNDITKVFQDGKLSPEQLTQIKALELQYQNEEKERGFRYEELLQKNTADARDMQKQTKSYFPATLSTIITVGFLRYPPVHDVWKRRAQ